jgi:hypothetical protein
MVMTNGTEPVAYPEGDYQTKSPGPGPNRAMRRGFVRKSRAYRLVFPPGSELDGAVVVMRRVPSGALFDLTKLAALADEQTPEGMAAIGDLFTMVADGLSSWNLQDELCDAHGREVGACEDCPDGAPTHLVPAPTTVEGVRSLDLQELMLLIGEWMTAAGGVSPSSPLDRSSSAGAPSVVAQLPMEPPSASRPSWPRPS